MKLADIDSSVFGGGKRADAKINSEPSPTRAKAQIMNTNHSGTL